MKYVSVIRFHKFDYLSCQHYLCYALAQIRFTYKIEQKIIKQICNIIRLLARQMGSFNNSAYIW